MCWTLRGLAVLLVLPGALAAEAAPRVSHKQVQAIKVEGTGGGSLQSITRTSDGRIVALVGASRYGGIRGGALNGPQTEIQVFDKDGNPLRKWNVDFPGQAIGAGPGGSIFVGGNGKVAKYDGGGKLLSQTELPHMAAILADKEGLQKMAEEQLEKQKESLERTRKAYLQQIERLKAQIAKVEESEEDEDGLLPGDKRQLSAAEERRLKRLKQQLATYEQAVNSKSAGGGDEPADVTVEAIIRQLVQRSAKVSGISATEKDVFIVCGEEKGYGFAAWRMDHNFEKPVKVLSELRGCCGQMDVQAAGDELFVAENTRHRVGRYDRDGKPIGDFGSTASRGNADGFGGCCNPMNLCFGPEGQVLTAESEGIIRRFSPAGDYLGLVGRVTLTGGCKNVAVAASPDGDRVYFCDLPGSRVIVLGPVADEAEAEALARPSKAQPDEAVESDKDGSDDKQAKESAENSNQEDDQPAAARKNPRFDARSRSALPARPSRTSAPPRAGRKVPQ